MEKFTNDMPERKDKDKAGRTLLVSALLSSPGPLILALGLTFGKSSTQLADFLRRSSELLALYSAYIVYVLSRSHPEKEAELKRRGNIFTGIVMCLSGVIMLVLNFAAKTEDKGNVLPALIIALLGAAVNIFFWRRYTSLSERQSDPLLEVQARLYRVKSSVDLCVCLTLASLVLFPASPLSSILDRFGSAAVSVYMLYSGLKTILGQRQSPLDTQGD